LPIGEALAKNKGANHMIKYLELSCLFTLGKYIQENHVSKTKRITVLVLEMMMQSRNARKHFLKSHFQYVYREIPKHLAPLFIIKFNYCSNFTEEDL